MIYFCDEDVNQIKPFVFYLQYKGHNVEILENADLAYQILSSANDIELALLDVMYAANPNKLSSIFNTAETRDFTITGLILLEKLISVRNDYFPLRAVFFSMVTDPILIETIQATSKKHKINFLRKSEFPTPDSFGERIDTIIDGINKYGSQL